MSRIQDYLLAEAYHERGMLGEARDQLRVALYKDPKMFATTAMQGYLVLQDQSIDDSFGMAERELDRLSTLIDKGNIRPDKNKTNIKTAVSQTGRYVSTLKGIAEGRIRIYVTENGKKGIFIMASGAYRHLKECLEGYGAKLSSNYNSKLDGKLIAQLVSPSLVTSMSKYQQINEGLFKGAFITSDQKVIIPGLKYFNELISGH